MRLLPVESYGCWNRVKSTLGALKPSMPACVKGAFSSLRDRFRSKPAPIVEKNFSQLKEALFPKKGLHQINAATCKLRTFTDGSWELVENNLPPRRFASFDELLQYLKKQETIDVWVILKDDGSKTYYYWDAMEGKFGKKFTCEKDLFYSISLDIDQSFQYTENSASKFVKVNSGFVSTTFKVFDDEQTFLLECEKDHNKKSFRKKCVGAAAIGGAVLAGAYALSSRAKALQEPADEPSNISKTNPTQPAFQVSSFVDVQSPLLTEEVPFTGPYTVTSDEFGPQNNAGLVSGVSLPQGVNVASQPMRVISSTPVVSSGANSDNTLATSGDKLFVSYGSTVQMIEVNNDKLQLLGYIGGGGTALAIDNNIMLSSMTGVPNYVFTATDIGNLLSTKPIASLAYSETCCYHQQMKIMNKKCYVTGHTFKVFDYSRLPFINITDSLPITSINPGGGIDIIDDNTVVIGANTPFPSLQFLDVSSNAKVIKVVPLPYQPSGVVVNGTTVVAGGGGVTSVIDFSGGISSASVVGSLSGVGGKMVRSNGLIYSLGPLSVQVVDAFTNKTAPKLVNSLPTGASFQFSSIGVMKDRIVFTDNLNVNLAYRGNTFNIYGTPAGGSEGNYTATLTAQAIGGPKQNKTIKITVQPAITGPANLPDMQAVVGVPFNSFIPAGTFKNVNNNALSYSITPSTWLQVGPNGALYGIPTPGDASSKVFTITATDTAGSKSSVQLKLNVLFGPAAVKSIGNDVIKDGIAYSRKLDPSVFQDKDTTGLTYSVTINGVPLKNGWLSVDLDTLTLLGTPTIDDIGSWSIIFLAQANGLTAQVPFQIIVVTTTVPEVANPPSTLIAKTRDYFFYKIPNNLFVDPLKGNVTLLPPKNLPGWLSYDEEKSAIGGTPGYGDTGALSDLTVQIILGGQSAYGTNIYNLNIQVIGESYVTLLCFKIFGPTLAILGCCYARWKIRAKYLHKIKKGNYRKLDTNATPGQHFHVPIQTDVTKIIGFSVLHKGKELIDGRLPYPFEHNVLTNEIVGDIPGDVKLNDLSIQVLTSGHKLQEQINIVIDRPQVIELAPL